MGDFDAAVEALEANQSSDAPGAPDTGSTPAPDSTPSSPDPAPSAPGESPSPTTPPAASPAKASAAPTAAPAAKPQPQMVRYEALRDAREQAKTLKETYGWLKPDHAPRVREFIEHYQRDPVTALVENLQGLLQDPRYAPQLQALMGQQGSADPEPQPDYQATDGTPVRSAANQAEWNEWRERRFEQKFSEKLRPLEQHLQTTQRQAHLAELQTKADTKAKALLEPYLGDQYFQEHRADIRARFQEYVGEMPGESALHRAYVEIIREKVLPGLSTAGAQSVVRQLNQKPGATGPNPARPTAASSSKKRYADFGEAMDAGVIG